jgi:predicted dehydrogenase
MAIDCLRAGRNVLVTKPWALNADGARAMIAASKASGAMLLPWLPARWGTDLTRLKELVASGAIGKVFQIRRSVSTFGIRHDWQTQKDCGGGYLLNWGPHIVDQPVQLSGSRVVSAFAQMRQVINPGDVEDHFFGVLVAENGIIIQVEHNIAAQGLFDWIVQGDRGTIYVRNGTELELHRVSFPENFDPASYRNAVTIDVTKETLGSRIYGDETEIYRHIARALRKQEPYAVAPESALTLSMELDAIRASSASGEAVRIA